MDKEILTYLQQIMAQLEAQSQKIDQQGETLKEHGQILKEHGQMLGALKTGQEFLKAELSELRLQNAKEFGEIKEQIKDIEATNEVLKDESWNNRKDIRRIQKTIGIK